MSIDQYLIDQIIQKEMLKLTATRTYTQIKNLQRQCNIALNQQQAILDQLSNPYVISQCDIYDHIRDIFTNLRNSTDIKQQIINLKYIYSVQAEQCISSADDSEIINSSMLCTPATLKRATIAQEKLSHSTFLYKSALSQLQRKNFEAHSESELCTVIDSMNNNDLQSFWQLVSQIQISVDNKRQRPQKLASRLSAFYEQTYRQHLFSYKLTHSDVTFLKRAYEQSESKISELTSELMKTHFKDKNVFSFSVH
ncbi:Hypothetical_protein [Hexamita inflata]|uniref:Hypothetical_protein n=1 Tax=Hexamita inflata TaxID=28002 RepID=A0AA86PRZ1_9EUKA|nr:Hypothetical protein HINF_LOCUS28075 [Hexamita inflata]